MKTDRRHPSPPSLWKRAALALASLYALGASAGGLNVDIRIGDNHRPPPVHEAVVVHDEWVVGPRRSLYDADLHLRLAQAAEYHASQDLEVARHREEDAAIAAEDADRAVADRKHDLDDREANAAARGDLERARRDVDAARAAVEDARHHADEAHDALEVVHRRGEPEFDASARARRANAALESARADLDLAEGKLERSRRIDGPSQEALDAARGRLRDAEARAAHVHDDLLAAHDAVYAARHRLADAHEDVCAALHDRDEALWLCHRDEIIDGRFDFATCGFHVDLAFVRAHRHDPEAIHRYLVHDVGYWRERPVDCHDRIVEVDHVGEIARVREVEHVREVERIREVEKVETVVKVEDRRHIAETVKVERDVYVKEKGEREVAVREGRKPQITQFVVHPPPDRHGKSDYHDDRDKLEFRNGRPIGVKGDRADSR
ncbi:MAG TPA: hypothetical protein VH475_19725 [Tepidisphaeraceae bacterium]